jgi:hypothetical protein
MFRRCACFLVLAALLVVPGQALATPFQFVYTDTIDSIAGTFPGISAGDTFTLTVVANNGSSSAASQQWLAGDIVSALLSVEGGAYSASYTPPGVCPLNGGICFETDANGDLTTAHYEDDQAPFLGTDSFGSDGNMLFSHLNIRNSTASGIAVYGAQTLANWEIAVVPEPSTALLMSLGLLAMGARTRREV